MESSGQRTGRALCRLSRGVSRRGERNRCATAGASEIIDLPRLFYAIVSAFDGQAQSLFVWSRTWRFCPRCAHPLRWKVLRAVFAARNLVDASMQVSRLSAECKECGSSFYPPVAPVAICLVRDIANECAFLVQLPRSAPGVFTCVAGFADPGETLETTARREVGASYLRLILLTHHCYQVAEEIGLDIVDVRYAHRSQPWPMPLASMMCAFVATADREQPVGRLPAIRWRSSMGALCAALAGARRSAGRWLVHARAGSRSAATRRGGSSPARCCTGEATTQPPCFIYVM